MKRAEEQQKQDKESSRLLSECRKVIASECKKAQEYIEINKKKIKEREERVKKTKKTTKMTEKSLAGKDVEMIHLKVQNDHFEDKMRIRDEYIPTEKEKYPFQLPMVNN